MLCSLQVFCGVLARAVIPDNIKAQLLAFQDGAHASALDSRDMDEYVRSAIIGLDETEPFSCIKELYDSGSHDDFLSIGHGQVLVTPNA